MLKINQLPELPLPEEEPELYTDDEDEELAFALRFLSFRSRLRLRRSLYLLSLLSRPLLVFFSLYLYLPLSFSL